MAGFGPTCRGLLLAVGVYAKNMLERLAQGKHVRQADHEYVVPEPDFVRYTVRLESLTYLGLAQ